MGEIQQDGLPLPRRNWAMAVIALGMTMAVLDGAIANVALPTIAGDLHVNPSSSIWVVNAFQLAMTISLLAFSSLGDLWGYKRVYVLGLSMFTVTSLICALSDSFITLVIARGLQGFSAAAITSVNTALLRVIFPARFLARGMGINGLIIAVAAAAGPTVAAGILAIADWPWLFAINVPIGLVAFVLSLKFLPRNPVKVEGQRYLGKWYEIARYDHRFERGLHYVTAEYSKRPDGKIKVLNCGHQDAVDGKEKCSIGKARPSHNGQPGQLQVAFFLSFYSDYNILELDPDYQWSLIGSSTDKYLWILSRTPHLDQNTLNQILEKARQRGYDTSRLIFPQQPES